MNNNIQITICFEYFQKIIKLVGAMTGKKKFLLFIFITVCIMAIADIWIYVFRNEYAHVIRVDGNGYYAYLPAVMIHKDLSFSFLSDTGDFLANGVNRYPIGVAICWVPFWCIGYLAYFLFSKANTGFGSLYEVLILISGIFYWCVGIICTYKSLKKLFSEEISLISCVLITYGTRLFHYATIDACLSHVYSFALVAILGYAFIIYVEKKSWGQSLLCGVLLGLITDIRNVNVIVAIIPVTYIISNCISNRKFDKKLLGNFIFALCGFVIAFFPMMLYWKLSSDQWIFNSYGEWSFDWLHPHFMQVFWGKDSVSGMLTLSPVLFLLIPGAIGLMRYYRDKSVSLSILICFFLDLYLISAWWTPASMGRRAYVNYLSIIAFLFGYVVNWIIQNNILSKKKNILINGVIGATVVWNLVQTIHYWLYF